MSISTLLLTSAIAFNTLVAGLPQLSAIQDVGPSCEGKDTGTRFTFTSGSVYDITCGSDYLGGDLRSFQTAVFQDCIAACDSDSSCGSLSFTSGICYLKSSAPTAVANSNVWAAKKQNAKSALTCVDKADHGKTYQASKSQFKIICGQEYGGGDLTSASTSSFEACIEACAATTLCIDVSYVNGACYLKQTTSTLIDASYVWTAQLVNSQASTQTGATASVDVTCEAGKDNGKPYKAKSGGTYTIECGIDHAGGDLKSLDSTTFSSCMDACDATDGCVDVSWVWGACYMKSTVNEGVAIDHVWTGRLSRAASISSESASISTLVSSAPASQSSSASTLSVTPVRTPTSTSATPFSTVSITSTIPFTTTPSPTVVRLSTASVATSSSSTSSAPACVPTFSIGHTRVRDNAYLGWTGTMTDWYVYNQVNGISISLPLLMTNTNTNYNTKFTLNSANQLVFVGSSSYDQLQENQKRLAADTGKSNFPGRMMFATQAGIDARTAWGGGVTPNGFATCRRDTSTTPNGLVCTRPGDSASRVWVCGGTVSFANDAPNNSCYEVRWTIVNEGCGVVKMWS